MKTENTDEADQKVKRLQNEPEEKLWWSGEERVTTTLSSVADGRLNRCKVEIKQSWSAGQLLKQCGLMPRLAQRKIRCTRQIEMCNRDWSWPRLIIPW